MNPTVPSSERLSAPAGVSGLTASCTYWLAASDFVVALTACSFEPSLSLLPSVVSSTTGLEPFAWFGR